jgi:DNA repair ATPase RecN
MNLSKQSTFHIDNFTKGLKKKENEIDHHSLEVTSYFEAMVKIKDYLGTVYNNDNIPVSERTKIFMEKLKELETLGEKHDKTVKKIKEIRDKINHEIEILINAIKDIDQLNNHEQIRNLIYQYIESKR